MEQLIELLQQIQELAGVGIATLKRCHPGTTEYELITGDHEVRMSRRRVGA